MTRPLPLTEAQFMKQITNLAELMGFDWMHIRAGRTVDSWRTPTSGTIGLGFPDLLLVRGAELIFAEVKTDTGKLTPAQERVLAILAKTAVVEIWRPKNWTAIRRCLSRDSRNEEVA